VLKKIVKQIGRSKLGSYARSVIDPELRRRRSLAERNIVDILGIGAQKSATSWAANVLSKHSEVWVPKEALSGKEMRFWTFHYRKGVDWYRAQMQPSVPGKLRMDFSPDYAAMSEARVKECAETSPDARIIYILRNPVERDWSSLKMIAAANGVDVKTQTFDQLKAHFEKWYKQVGVFSEYSATISRWRKHYSADQFFIGFYDDVSSAPLETYDALISHCGIKKKLPEKRLEHVLNIKVFKGVDAPMPEEFRRFLRERHMPELDRLERLVDRNLSSWRV
jgi:hypothetical protein